MTTRKQADRVAVAGKKIGPATMAKLAKQPLTGFVWVDRSAVQPNDYNPNSQPPPEFRLLKISILQDGWTQPIVAFRDRGAAASEPATIVDGEHRWTVAADPEVAALTDGKIPVVFIVGDLEHRMMSTIRHNRARGEHGVLPMAEIVKKLLQSGTPKTDVMFLLQMEEEEVDRLAERGGMPAVGSREQGNEFSKGWMPK